MSQKDRVYIRDELMEMVHTKQIINEIRERIPSQHFKNSSDSEGKFETITFKIPRKVWLSSYPSIENKELWYNTIVELQNAQKRNI